MRGSHPCLRSVPLPMSAVRTQAQVGPGKKNRTHALLPEPVFESKAPGSFVIFQRIRVATACVARSLQTRIESSAFPRPRPLAGVSVLPNGQFPCSRLGRSAERPHRPAIFSQAAINLLSTSTIREIAIKHMVAKSSTPIFRPSGIRGNGDAGPFDGILRVSFEAGPWLLRAQEAHWQQCPSLVPGWLW